MIQSLLIENFRGFQSLKIEPLKAINLFAGENSTGKTAILEAVYLLILGEVSDIQRLPGAFRSGQRNEDNFKHFWEFLFPAGERVLEPTVRGLQNGKERWFCGLGKGEQESMRISHRLPGSGSNIVRTGMGPFGVFPNGGVTGGHNPGRLRFLVYSTPPADPTSDAELYNQASLPGGNEERIREFMRLLEPRLEKLRYAKLPGTSQPMVYAYLGGLKNPIPVTQAGQGFSKLLTLFCAMLVSKAQVLLIDEMENGLYYSILPQIWRGLAALAESEQIQVFATTHSRECIVAAHEAMKETGKYNFALHRLQRVKNRIEAITLDQEKIEVAVKSGLEVR